MELGTTWRLPGETRLSGFGQTLATSRRIAGFLLLPALTAVLAYGAGAHGAFSPERGRIVAAVLALLAPAAGAISLRHARPFAIGFASLGMGVLVGAGAHGWPADAAVPALTLLTALGSFLVTREIVLRGERDSLLRAVVWTGGIVAALGIVAVAVHAQPWASLATGLWRLSSTMSYANAAASLLALCLPAALLLLGQRDDAFRRATVFLISVGFLLTLSRGALFALVLALPVVLALGGWPVVKGAIRPILGSLVAFLGALPSVTAETGRPIPVVMGLVAGGAIAIAPIPSAWGSGARRAFLGHRAAVLILIGVSIALLGAAVLGREGVERLSASRVDLAGEGRWANWSSQLSASLDVPLLGNGFRVYPPTEANRYAHNEYLQVFHDTGVVGLASVFLAIAAFAVGIAKRRRTGPEGIVWATGIGACAVFAFQSGVDFLWRFPVLVLMAFLWLAIAVTTPMEEATDA